MFPDDELSLSRCFPLGVLAGDPCALHSDFLGYQRATHAFWKGLYLYFVLSISRLRTAPFLDAFRATSAQWLSAALGFLLAIRLFLFVTVLGFFCALLRSAIASCTQSNRSVFAVRSEAWHNVRKLVEVPRAWLNSAASECACKAVT